MTRKAPRGTPVLTVAKRPRTAPSALGARARVGARRLAELIEEATVDAYGPEEQAVGFFTMLEEHLAVPFETQVLGVDVRVTRVELNDAEEIVAVCARGRHVQRIAVVDLPLPRPLPDGAEWIEAYRAWRAGG